MRLNRIYYPLLIFILLPIIFNSCLLSEFVDDNDGPLETVPDGVKKWINMYVNERQLQFESLSGEKQIVRVDYHYEVIKGSGYWASREYVYVNIKDANNNVILRINTDSNRSAFDLKADDEYGTVEVDGNGEVIKSTPFIFGNLETMPAIELHGVRYENLLHFIAPNGVEFYYSQNEGLVNFTIWRYGKMTEWFKI